MLILCKAWAPRRRLCDVQNGEGGLLFPYEPFGFHSCSWKTGFFFFFKEKKVVLILALFSWRKGRCVALDFSFFPPQIWTQQTSDSLQLWLSREVQSVCICCLFLDALAARFLACWLCVWMKKRREQSVFFSWLEGDGVAFNVLRGSLRFSVPPGSYQIQKRRVPVTRWFSCILIRCLILLYTCARTHAERYLATLQTTSVDNIHSLNTYLKV